MSSSKNIDLQRGFAAGVDQSFETGDTVSHVGIFDPALWTVALLTLSLVQLSSPSPRPCLNNYTVYTYTVC